ncbi:MAG TPA: FMN-binding glutamate synthase family protein [Thermoguttaceae bacterium]|nr:FMN-binding glutamate synthase family protein [Thermoguttaceae bacterium]
MDGCTGNCEVFRATFRGRELLYPGPYGEVTAGADKDYPVDYSHLNIQGYALGGAGLPDGQTANPDTCTFPSVNIGTEYGWDQKVKMAAPVFTGALGSTEIARKNWEHFAVGAAIAGVTLVCGENVCGIDPQLELDSKGKIASSPDMDRRIETYRRYHRGLGEILVQMNVEDTRLGVAEYVSKKHGLKTIELKWGQGAKCIGGEIKVGSLERALELQKRGYIVTPDPSNPVIQAAFKEGAIKEFERHSRLGFVDQEGFMAECDRLRNLGFERITLKTGAYPLRELAMAIKWGSKAKIDLLTIDGAPGGTGMSPWRMMEEWGVPAIYLHAAAAQFAGKLAAKGERVPDMAFAGGFSAEDHIFKCLALGAPYVKAVCMGRALMIPGMVGKNVTNWMNNGGLPKNVAQYGSKVEEIFICYEQVAEIVGKNEMKNIPLGAIGIFSYAEKMSIGLQQLMAGARCFSVPSITRKEIFSLTRECADVTGIPFVMDAYREEAEAILDA